MNLQGGQQRKWIRCMLPGSALMGRSLCLATSRYWNMVHGNTPEEVRKDEEGMQIMRYLGRNMAWLLKLKEAGKEAGIEFPRQEENRTSTNFIR